MSERPDLILCLAMGYRLADIEPFVASWQESAPAAALAMFTRDMDERFDEAARRFGIELLDATPFLAPDRHIAISRFYMYRDYLGAHAERFASVLITDVRDVAFQGDPFAVARPKAVSCAAEDQTIGQCGWNTGWLRSAYGEDVVRALADRTISCSGTTIGTVEGIRAYVDLVIGEAEGNPEAARITGIDQGFHNYVLWHRSPDFMALDPGDRIVATLGYTPRAAISVDEGEISVGGVASPVLHQWDRHPDVAQHLSGRYRVPTT